MNTENLRDDVERCRKLVVTMPASLKDAIRTSISLHVMNGMPHADAIKSVADAYARSYGDDAAAEDVYAVGCVDLADAAALFGST